MDLQHTQKKKSTAGHTTRVSTRQCSAVQCVVAMGTAPAVHTACCRLSVSWAVEHALDVLLWAEDGVAEGGCLCSDEGSGRGGGTRAQISHEKELNRPHREAVCVYVCVCVCVCTQSSMQTNLEGGGVKVVHHNLLWDGVDLLVLAQNHAALGLNLARVVAGVGEDVAQEIDRRVCVACEAAGCANTRTHTHTHTHTHKYTHKYMQQQVCCWCEESLLKCTHTHTPMRALRCVRTYPCTQWIRGMCMHRDACQAAQPAVAIPVETQGGQVGNGVSNAAKADTEAGTSEKRRHAHAHTHTHTRTHTHTPVYQCRSGCGSWCP